MFSLLDESLRVANGMSSVWPHVDSFYTSRTLVPPLISVAELGGSSMVRVCSPSYLLISEQLTYTLDNLSFPSQSVGINALLCLSGLISNTPD